MQIKEEDLPDRDEREAATCQLDCTFAVEASAGTGKTSLIVQRTLNLLEQGRAEAHEIAVITFTEKAATELEERLRDRIQGRISDIRRGEGKPPADDAALYRLSAASRSLDRASIRTIHAFAASLLRLRPVEAGVDPLFAMADEEAQASLFEDAWSAFLADPGTAADPLRLVLKEGVTVDQIRDLGQRLIENRDFLDRGLPPRAGRPDPLATIGAVAREIEEGLERLRAACADPSDKLLAALEARCAEALDLARGPAKAAHERLLAGSLKIRRNLGRSGNWKGGALDRARALAASCEEASRSYQADLGATVTGEAARALASFAARYEAEKQRRGLLDFQDLLLKCRNLLRNASAARDFQSLYRHVLVDEFQDTDPLQVEIVALLTGEGPTSRWQERRPRDGALFIVGDPKQSIYRFRRADVAIYAETRRWIEERLGSGACLTVVANFRCRPAITEWVNALFQKLIGEEDPTQGPYAPLSATRPESDAPAVRYLVPAVAGRVGPSDEDSGGIGESRELEALMLARAIREALDSGAWPVGIEKDAAVRPARCEDIVILLRAFSDVALYEAALEDAGLPSVTSGGRRYYLRPEIAWLAALIRAVESPADEVSVVAALRSPYFGLTDGAIFEARRLGGGRLDPHRPPPSGSEVARALAKLGEWHLTRHDLALERAVRRILDESGALLLASLRPGGEQRALNLMKVADLARRKEKDGAGFRAFARWLSRSSLEEAEESDSPLVEENRGAIRLMTIHAAKGLEFPIVILADLARGLPAREGFLLDRNNERIEFRLGSGERAFRTGGFERLSENETAEQRSERRRHLYVAATRARDLLILPLTGPFDVKGSFLEDLASGGAIPAEIGPALTALESAGEGGADWVLPNGARVRAQGVEIAPGEAASARPRPDREYSAAMAPGAGSGAGGPEVDRRTKPADELPDLVALLNAWVSEREALIGAAGRGPEFVAASRAPSIPDERAAAPAAPDHLTVDEEPRYEPTGGDLQGAPRGWSGARRPTDERSRAAAFGLAVHAALERIDVDEPGDVAFHAGFAAAACCVEERREQVEAAARQAIARPVMQSARSRPALHEIPVSLAGENVLVEGQIDFAYLDEGGSLVVVDFKTDAVADESEARRKGEGYLTQLALYAEGLERATKIPVRETVLLFVPAGIEIRYPFDDRARERARAVLSGAGLARGTS